MSQLSQDTNAPKKPFSLSLSSSSTPNGQTQKTSFNQKSLSRDAPNRSLPRRPRKLHHDESGDEEEAAPAHEAVTGFDTHTGAAIAADGSEISHEKRQLVIPVSSQNNWRDRPGVNRRPRGGKNLLPKEVQAIRDAEARGETVGDNVEREGPSMAYGISYAQPSQDAEVDGDKQMKDAGPDVGEQQQPQPQPSQPRTEDEIALQALIRETNGETQGGSDLVIESARRDDEGTRYDETTSFRADIKARPESATLDQYNAVPVEEFGAALLRGMGWKDGQAVGRGNYATSATADRATRPRIPERRPGFLGIGAKDVSGGKGAEMELGAWGKSAMRKGSRKAGQEEGGNTEGVYMPVMMKNKQTSEYITEEELTALQKEAKSRKRDDDDEWKERRDRNLEKSGRDRYRDRDREYRRRDYDDGDDSDRYDRRKTGSSRRDRSLSGDRHSRRRRYDDEDSRSRRDDRYYRDRERRRERDRSKDRERDRSHRYRDDDQYSSRHSSSHTSSRHGRGRDRDREKDSGRDSYRRRRHDDR